MKQFLLMSSDKTEIAVVAEVVGEFCEYVPGFSLWGTYYNGDRYGMFPVNGKERIDGTLKDDITFLKSLDCKLVEIC